MDRQERPAVLDRAVGVEGDGLHPVRRPLEEEVAVVEVLRELRRRRVRGVVLVARAGHRAAAEEIVERGRGRVGAVGPPHRPRRVVRDVAQAGIDERTRRRRKVVRGIVDEVVAVVVAARDLVDVVPVRVGLVGDVAVRPAIVGGLLLQDHRHVPGRAACRMLERGVRAVVGEPDLAVVLGGADRERVAQAHRVDLAQGLAAAVLGAREHVPGRDRVRAALADRRSRVRERMDPQDLAHRIAGVGRRRLRVVGDLPGRRPALACHPLVHRRIALRGAAPGVVAGRDVEVAVGRELQVARTVTTARIGRMLHVIDALLRRQVQRVAVERETRHARDPRRRVRRRQRHVVHEDVLRRREIRRHRQAHEAELPRNPGRDLTRDHRRARVRLEDLQPSVALGQQYPAVRRGRDPDPLRDVLVQQRDLEAVVLRWCLRTCDSRRRRQGADRADHARDGDSPCPSPLAQNSPSPYFGR